MVPNSFLIDLIALFVSTIEELGDVSAIVVLKNENTARVELLEIANFDNVVIDNRKCFTLNVDSILELIDGHLWLILLHGKLSCVRPAPYLVNHFDEDCENRKEDHIW